MWKKSFMTYQDKRQAEYERKKASKKRKVA